MAQVTRTMIFETERLIIRRATTSNIDVELFHSLWNNPTVMRLVGFPEGLKIEMDEIRDGIAKQDDSEYDKKLIVQLKSTGELIGECKLGLPDDDGISETDVNLKSEFWSRGYGKEVKRGLVDYLFTHTACQGVKGTPNKMNIASQKMQQSVGAVKIDEGTFKAPPNSQLPRIDVPYYTYIVYRKDWEKAE